MAESRIASPAGYPARPHAVRLRPLRTADAAAWAALHGDPAAMAHVASPLDAEAAARRFDAALAANARTPPRRRTWAIDADGTFAGVAGLVFDAPDEAELGAILARAAQGRGIATRALACLVAHAFAAFRLRRVHTRHAAAHAAAAGLMRTLGFAIVDDGTGGAPLRWQCTALLAAPRADDSLEPIR